MSIAEFIGRKKQAIRDQKDRLLGSSEEKIKYMQKEKEYLDAKQREKDLRSEIRSKKFSGVKKFGTSAKKNIQEFKKSRASKINSSEYKDNVWRNQGSSSSNVWTGSPEIKKSSTKKKKKVIIEYE